MYMSRNEEGKKFAFKDLGFDSHVVASLKLAMSHEGTEDGKELLKEVCKAIRLFCVNDDKREGVTPEIFNRARALGESGRSGEDGVMPYLVPAVEMVSGTQASGSEDGEGDTGGGGDGVGGGGGEGSGGSGVGGGGGLGSGLGSGVMGRGGEEGGSSN